MKPMNFCKIFFLVCIYGNLISQTSPPVGSVEVNYKLSNLLLSDTTNPSIINVLPEVTIALTSTANVSKVYLRIIKPSDGSVVYNVNYNINSSAIVDNDGITLYNRSNSTIHINSPNIVPLNVYNYELVTEDNQGNLSTPFSEIH